MSTPSRHDDFIGRVNYAAQCFVRHIRSSRTLDACFEMFDGDAVVTALVRRARNNPTLSAAIAAQWPEGFPQSWVDIEARYANWPTRRLADLARDLRANGQRESDQRLEQLTRRTPDTH